MSCGYRFLSYVQAGFLFSGRVGSGLVIARLPDGCKLKSILSANLLAWSAPSALITAGMGFGGQIGIFYI